MGVQRASLAIVAVSVLAGCGVSVTPPGAVPTQWGDEASPIPIPSEVPRSELGFTERQVAAVRIHNDGCEYLGTGSGFAIDEHTVVTNRHVIEDHSTLTATLYDGTPLTITGSYVSNFGDLGVVTIEQELPSVVELAPEDPELKDYVRIVGYPNGEELTVTEGIILNEVDDELEGEGQVFATTAEAHPGSSGSAAYDAAGRVIGVLYAGDDYGLTFIVPVEMLIDLLENAERKEANKRACTY